ncbi:uncharacterized protein BcabD6B2_26740 [Babesia caballi]|uniref:Uncharacterized protein n=1 Tax=Babesia caballi TaxID=5871 RepID=A0AAV4LXN0_BABCB|nr:hypothetical protein, conserved [Babesia caballi]
MSYTSPKYDSLTHPPKNLKESIDWMLRISGKDGGDGGTWGMSELPRYILTLLNKSNEDLTEAVKKTFDEAVQNVTKDLKDKLGGTKGVFADYLRKFTVTSVGNTIHVDFDKWVTAVKQWIEKGCNPVCETDGPMAKFADGLAVFMGYYNGQLNDEGLGKNGSYESAYDAKNATWAAVKTSNKENECALIFLDAVIILFPLFTLLYWNGRRNINNKGQIPSGDWADQKLTNKNSELSKFLITVGFSDFSQLHTVYTKIVGHKTYNNYATRTQDRLLDPSVKGSTLSGRTQTAFDEFGRVMGGEDPPTTYGGFLEALMTRARCDISKSLGNNRVCTHTDSSTCDPSKFPFTKLFIVSTAYKIAVATTSPTKTILASAAAVTGVGVSAYLAYLYGLLPTLGVL